MSGKTSPGSRVHRRACLRIIKEMNRDGETADDHEPRATGCRAIPGDRRLRRDSAFTADAGHGADSTEDPFEPATAPY